MGCGTYKILVGDSSAEVKEAGTWAVDETLQYKTDDVTGTEIQNLFTNERAENLTTLSKYDPEGTYPTKPEANIAEESETEETVAEETVTATG